MTAETIDYASALLEQNELLVETFSGADLSIAVPTCPGWSLLQLMRHVGRGDRWAAQMIRENISELDVRAVVDGRPPDDVELALVWLRSSPAVVVEAVANSGENSLVPTLVGPRPGVWWLRRRLHEATVHRADAAIARTAVGDKVTYQLDGADTTMTGTAENLFLAMVRRRNIEQAQVQLDGDPGVWQAWLATTPL